MEERNHLIKYLNAKFEEINRRFDKNDEEHKNVNQHLAKLNGQTSKNTSFRNRYQGIMEMLVDDREHKVRLVSDLFWKAILIGVLILLGLDKFINVL